MALSNERVKFSWYGISVECPADWQIGINPKEPPSTLGGFVRLENFVPRKGSDVSLGINWQKQPTTNLEFAENYAKNLEGQFQKQFRKTPYKITTLEVIDFLDGKAVYSESEHIGVQGLVRSKKDQAVKTIQLAYYDEPSKHVVVLSIIGTHEIFETEYEALKEIIFSLKFEPIRVIQDDSQQLTGDAVALESPEMEEVLEAPAEE